MITNTGKAILSKYLIGQSPSYASHISIGCGAKPLNSEQEFSDYSEKTTMDFEMFRVPILSRGYVADEFGTTSVAFSAELPTEERYEITEVGIFSSGSNPSAGSRDSKTLFTISREEGWEYHDQTSARQIPTVLIPLNDNDTSSADIDFSIPTSPEDPTPITPTVFYANASNTVFESGNRIARGERCRFLDNMIMIRGDEGDISSDLVENTSSSNHIHLTGITLPLDRNAATDQLKLAFSVINRTESAGNPDEVRIIMEFRSTESATTEAQVATFKESITDFSGSRYFVVSKQLQELQKTINFTWSSIGVVKISAMVVKDGVASSDWYVAIDGVRLENVSTINPLYGLTGYSVVRTIDGLPVIKSSNTKGLVEFRFSIDVDGPPGAS